MTYKPIPVPVVIWALGDPEQSTNSGVTVMVRPLYHRTGKEIGEAMTRIGEINPDYSEALMTALFESPASARNSR